MHGLWKVLKKDPRISLTMDLNKESMEKKELRRTNMRTIDNLFVCESKGCTCFEVLSFWQKSGKMCVCVCVCVFFFFIKILCEMACFCDFSFVAIL